MISPNLLAIGNAIKTQEGWFPGSLSQRNNNPGNLRFVGQRGAVQGEGGFAAFSSAEAGFQALLDQINLNVTRGTDAAGRPVKTVADLIYSWAPPNENDTPAYIASINRQTGFAGSDSLADLLTGGRSAAESGTGAAAGDDYSTAALDPLSGSVDLEYVALAAGAGLLGLWLLSRLV